MNCSSLTSSTDSSEWWKHGPIYQIYPRSYQDSTGNGTGDLRGIQSRLDYLEFLGINILWLSPIYKSPMVDFGYDISDFYDIDPIFGTLDDFDELLKDIHSRGMKLLMDFVPNHSSDQHNWFQLSKKRHSKYDDYYVWKDPKVNSRGERCPPTNWMSVFGGSAWTFCPERNQYYYHQFYKEQPDLNYRNPQVQEEMLNILKFWFDRGVDGLRVDAINHMYESESLEDEPIRKPSVVSSSDEYLFTVKKFTICQPETYQTVEKWATLAESYNNQRGRSKIFIVNEVYRDKDVTFQNIMNYYVRDQTVPFNFILIDATMPLEKSRQSNFDSELALSLKIKRAIEVWLHHMPAGKLACWVVGNHDNKRIANRVGRHLVNVFNTLLLTLPGTPFTYQGEELGLTDVPIAFDQVKDPIGLRFGKQRYLEFTRDPCRSPMPWSKAKNAGFSTADSTWLPIAPDYKDVCVETQKGSLICTPLKVYRELVRLRMISDDLKYGTYQTVFCNDLIFCYSRKSGISNGTFVLLNFSDSDVLLPFGFFQKFVISANKRVSFSVSLLFDSLQSFDDKILNLTITHEKSVVMKGQALIFQLIE